MNRSRGHSLLELMVCMSVGTTLVVLATGVVHKIMRFESSSRQQADAQRAAVRLVKDFRRDVHRADDIRLSDEDEKLPTIQLLLPDGEPVSYIVRAGMVLREQRLDAEQVRREPYYLPAGYRTIFGQVFRPRRASLTVELDHGLVGEPLRTIVHVEAEVGRYLRLAQTRERAP